MRIMARLLLSAVLVQTPPWVAARATEIDACSGQSQSDRRACLETTVKTSAGELAQAEQEAVTALTRWDEDQHYRSTANTALQAANKSFIQFRAAQCGFAAALGGGSAGNARELRRLACVTELNHTRATHLLQQFKDLPMK